MRAAYFRELRPYSEEEIRAELAVGNDKTRAVIDTLMDCGIIQYRTGDEQGEEKLLDAEGANARQRYQFRFVGIAIARGHAIVCYPKYIRSTTRPEKQMRQTLNVIRKLGQEGRLLDSQDDGARRDQLALMLRLLWLYDEYGVYSNYEETRMLNGSGVIDWQRTIDMQTPVISDGVPIYLDIWTRKTRRDEYDLIMQLHRAILSDCSRFLLDSGISDLLSINVAVLTDEGANDLGEPEYLLWLIDRERAGQYVTWKQDVLDLMRLYITGEGTEADKGAVLRLGTTSYYHAWEVACKAAFGDLLDYRLRKLPSFTLCKEWDGCRDMTLLQIIPRPIWERPKGLGDSGDVDTLIPDIVTFVDHDGRRLFCIYDAKYYVPSKNGKMTGQPGVESVTKQFLYQSAYQRFIDDHDFDGVVNAFLVPTEGDDPEPLASVTFSDVMAGATAMSPRFSDRIDMWALPAYEVFDCYLRGHELNRAIYEPMLDGIAGL